MAATSVGVIDPPRRWLVYGARGFIGWHVMRQLNECFPDDHVDIGYARCEDQEAVGRELVLKKPTHVVCCVGRTRGDECASIDALEEGVDALRGNVWDNLLAPLLLAKQCESHEAHFTYMGTGCIFDDAAAGGQSEYLDQPNYFGSSYSVVKGATDVLMRTFVTTLDEGKLSLALNVRLRMPVTSDMDPRGFVAKVVKYRGSLCPSRNSITFLDSVLPHVLDYARSGGTGTLNAVNPGPVDHLHVLRAYDRIVQPMQDPRLLETAIIDKSTLSARRKAERCDNTMSSVSRILQHLPSAAHATIATMHAIRARLPPGVLSAAACERVPRYAVVTVVSDMRHLDVARCRVSTLGLKQDGARAHVYRTRESSVTDVDIAECFPSARLPLERTDSLQEALTLALESGLCGGDVEMVVGLAPESLRCTASCTSRRCRWVNEKDVREFRRDASVMWVSGLRGDVGEPILPCGEVLLKAPQFHDIMQERGDPTIAIGDLSAMMQLARDAGHQVTW